MHNLSLAPLALLLPGGLIAAKPEAGGLFISNYNHVLGTSLTIKLIAPSLVVARHAEQVLLREIFRLEAVLSAYQANSEFAQWLAAPINKAIAISPDLFAVLDKFDQWRERTNGAINAAAEHLNQIWRHAALSGKTPAEANRHLAVAMVNQKHWHLDAANVTATRLTQVPLRLHTFTKSYVLHKASQKVLNLPGVDGLVLNSGGDILVSGNWQENIAVSNPQAHAENEPPLTSIRVQNTMVATSGAYRRGVQVGGAWASHIINPLTGLPADEIISATVVHPEAVTAGALATAFNVLSPAESALLAKQIPGSEYLLVTRAGEMLTSAGWPGNTTAPAENNLNPVVNGPITAHVLSVGAKDKLWNPKEELLIKLELARFEGRSHRPFVAVWIENEAGKPIRQLALWYNKPKWLKDLRQWNQIRPEDASSVTSATRSPGEYTLIWDGKDDNGNLVKQGKYRVMIEAAREHGTYQLIRETLDFNGKLKQKTLKGNVEITAAALDYREKNPAR